VDDRGLLRQAVSEESGGAFARVGRQFAEDGEAAQGEGGVVEVGAALASGEAAVGRLGGAEVGGVTAARLRRQAGQAGRESGGQAEEVVVGVHAGTAPGLTGPTTAVIVTGAACITPRPG